MPKPIKPSLTALPYGWLLGGIIVIAAIGIWRNNELTKSPAPPPTTAPSQWQKVISPQAVFSTQVMLDRINTFVLLPIRFENNPQTTWLSFDSTDSAKLHEFLIIHPKLLELNWDKIDDNSIHLYQRKKVYKSIDEFLKNPPPKEKILSDFAVMQISPYNQLQLTELSEQSDITTVDYILTSYIPLKQKDGAFYYENIIDASQATVANNKMSWSIFISKTSDTNPYYLGNIHIDYNRK